MSDRDLLDIVRESGPVRWYKSRLSGHLTSLCARCARVAWRRLAYVPVDGPEIPRLFSTTPYGCSVCTEGTP